MERINKIEDIKSTIAKLQQDNNELHQSIKEQFESDMEHLKLYSTEEGVVRLQVWGSIDKICEYMTSNIELVNECLEQAIKAARKLEVIK